MYWDNKLGLVIFDDGDRRGYIAWPQVHAAVRHFKEGKTVWTCPINLTREQWSFICRWALENEA